jgi:hypothetical protein
VTEPAPPPPPPHGGPSPLRVGGLALLGAGAVAALIGLATLLPGGGGSSTPAPTPEPVPSAAPSAAATPGATVAAPAPSAPAAVPTVGPTAAVAAPPAAPAPAPAPAPAAPQAGAGTGGGGGSAAARGPVRVYNNSTVTGLAARAANDFRADGWQVGAVSNYSSGVIPTSTVYYRPGTAEQSAASTIASEFGLRSEPRFSGIDDATPGLIVIVTNDYQKRK